MKQMLSVLAVGVLLLVSCKNESQPAAQNTTTSNTKAPNGISKSPTNKPFVGLFFLKIYYIYYT
jgi:hypothetical protein